MVIQKVEKRVIVSCNLWLSLEGFLVLVKLVLESILVYYLSLMKVCKFIVENIRRNLFSFLWFGNKMKVGIHMVKWSMLARTKKVGG